MKIKLSWEAKDEIRRLVSELKEKLPLTINKNEAINYQPQIRSGITILPLINK